MLDGQIDAGVGLTETDVATEYEVSRPTAKTAISQLVQEGLLRREAHKSAHVPSLSREDVEDLFLVRMPLELEVVRRVVGKPIPAGRRRRSARPGRRSRPRPVTASSSRPTCGSTGRWSRPCDSPRLTRLYQALSGEIHLSMVQSRYALGRDRIVAEHGGVLAALRQGDAAAGREADARAPGGCPRRAGRSSSTGINADLN